MCLWLYSAKTSHNSVPAAAILRAHTMRRFMPVERPLGKGRMDIFHYFFTTSYQEIGRGRHVVDSGTNRQKNKPGCSVWTRNSSAPVAFWPPHHRADRWCQRVLPCFTPRSDHRLSCRRRDAVCLLVNLVSCQRVLERAWGRERERRNAVFCIPTAPQILSLPHLILFALRAYFWKILSRSDGSCVCARWRSDGPRQRVGAGHVAKIAIVVLIIVVVVVVFHRCRDTSDVPGDFDRRLGSGLPAHGGT